MSRPSKTTIYINGRFLCRPMTGVDRYAIETLAALDALLAEGHPLATRFDWTILTGSNEQHGPAWPHLTIQRTDQPASTRWEQTHLPLAARDGVLLSLCNAAPLLHPRQFVVIHDAATRRAPYSYGRGFRAWYQLMIPWLLRTAKGVATVSAFSRHELAQLYGCQREIHVVTEGAEHLKRVPADDSILRQHGLQARPFVLGVSSMAPHKSFKTIVDAIGLLDAPPFDLVLAGGANPRIFAQGDASFPAWVRTVGYVSDAQLRALYEHAACFIFPSLYEGYGLPPTEAMALGCPVISSSCASLPEVCGNAALYFEGGNPRDLAQKLNEFFADPAMAGLLKTKGLHNVELKSWRQAALSLLEALHNTFAST